MVKIKKKNIILACFSTCMFLYAFLLFICNTDNKYLGGGFTFSTEHKHITGKIDIPPTIITYDYDKNFILLNKNQKKLMMLFMIKEIILTH